MFRVDPQQIRIPCLQGSKIGGKSCLSKRAHRRAHPSTGAKLRTTVTPLHRQQTTNEVRFPRKITLHQCCCAFCRAHNARTPCTPRFPKAPCHRPGGGALTSTHAVVCSCAAAALLSHTAQANVRECERERERERERELTRHHTASTMCA